MDVKSHVNFLIEEYKLKPLYYKFITLSSITSLIRESFYWILIYFSIKLESKKDIKKVSGILLGILLVNIPIEKQANQYRIDLIKELKNVNNIHFITKLKNTSKKDLLNIDLVYYFNTLQTLNIHIQEYIINRKILMDIPITFISVLIIILSKDLGKNASTGKLLLVILLVIFFILIIYLNEKEIKNEMVVVEDSMIYDNMTRDYLINSKTFLMNNNFNQEYMMKNVNEFNKLNSKMENMENKLSVHTNLSMFVVFSIIISYFLEEIKQSNIIRYFLIIYDIDTISKKVRDFYKNKMSYDKMELKLKSLDEIINDHNLSIDKSAEKIDKIIIKNIENDKPKLKLLHPLEFRKGDHKLIDGVSGSGKTSLMYLLKGIMTVNYCKIEPSLEKIHSRCFITLPNHRDLYSAKLYDILTNFDKNPNIKLINYVLKIVKLEKYSKKENINSFIDVESLSAGEFTRVMIARLIYQIKSEDSYDILLFDEIDMNLNNDLSIELCKTLREIFEDKIILYITHNDDVKKLFTDTIIVKNGIIH